MTYESGRVVVSCGFGVTESLKQGVSLDDLLIQISFNFGSTSSSSSSSCSIVLFWVNRVKIIWNRFFLLFFFGSIFLFRFFLSFSFCLLIAHVAVVVWKYFYLFAVDVADVAVLYCVLS